MTTLWKRRSVIAFFLVGFGIPWLGWTTRAVTGIEGPGATALFYTGDFMTVGGFVAAFVAAGALGFRSLLRRCFQIRAPIGWALFALFIPLTWAAIPALIYGATHDGIGRIELAGLAQYFAPGVLLALTTGPLGEEAGWRGFLQPRMVKRYSPLVASLIIGVIWSLWHYPLYFDSVFSTGMGAARFTLSTICFSVLLTVLWGFTRASVFWAIILHWTINISGNVTARVFPDIQPPQGATDLTQSVMLVLVTIVVFVWVGRERLERKLAEAMETLGDEAIEADRVTAA